MLATHEVNKQQIINYLLVTRQAVLDAVAGLDEAQLATPLGPEGRTARDILAHLLVWDWAKLDMIRQRAQGATPAAVEMTRNVDGVNAQAEAQWRARPLADLLGELQRVRAELLAAIDALDDRQLLEPAGAPWPPTAPLLEAIEGTGEHNAEHAAELAAWRARLGLAAPGAGAEPPPLPGKADLLAYLQATRQQVLDALGGLSREQLQTPGVTAEGWAPRDLLATLAAWDREVATAVRQIAGGEHPLIPDMTPEDLARFDARAVERGRTLPLEALRDELRAARGALLAAVEPLSEAQIYQPPHAAGDMTSTVGGFLQVRAGQDSARAGELALWRATLV
jgi:hypothetical protein